MAVQLTFAVTETVDDDAADPSDTDDADSVRLLADAAACVTAIVRVMPPPVTVTVPVRGAVPVLAVELTLKLPLFAPDVGEALNQL